MEAYVVETDPVCGMEVDPGTAQHTSIHRGKTYYFCAPGCKRQFDRQPEEFTGPSAHRGHEGHGGHH